ncbi:MAG TPA: hypothetical protein VIF62_14690, partial [Labilithrix sp.]
MLPKIRPAAAGTAVRPSIRPVKPSVPPPPPAPPRRFPSGVAPKNTTMDLHHADADAIDDDGPLTAVAPYSDLPTNPQAAQVEDLRATNLVVSFEDETQARAVDEYLLQSMRPDERPQGELAVAYESLPSLEARRPFDTYEAEFAERDPVTQMVAAHESIRLRRGREQHPPEEPHVEVENEQAYEEAYDDHGYTEPPRDGSGPRVRPSDEPREDYAGYAAPVPAYDDPHESWQSGPQERGWESPPNTVIPPAPAVPREMRAPLPLGFIQGVQPVRAANNFTPFPQPLPQQQMIPTSPPPPVFGPMPGQRMVPTSPSAARAAFPMPMQPVGPQVAPAAKSSGVGRFAWFVFGAAFGIAFAFVATGFVPKLSSAPDPLFPPPPPKPAVTVQAQAPAAPAPPPPAAVTAPPATPSSLPAAKDPPKPL